MNINYHVTMAKSSAVSCPSSTSSPIVGADILTEFLTQNLIASPSCSSEPDHSSSNSQSSTIENSEFDSYHSDSIFWSQAPINESSNFKSPNTKTINDLIESPILNKTIIHKDRDYLSHLPARKLAFGSPEVARVEMSPKQGSHRNMITGPTTSNVCFEDSPEAPKSLPRATRTALMLERSNAANKMIRSSPLTNNLTKQHSNLSNNYRFGVKSSASFSTPQQSLSNTSSLSSSTESPKRSSTLILLGSRGKAFLNAFKSTPSEIKNIDEVKIDNSESVSNSSIFDQTNIVEACETNSDKNANDFETPTKNSDSSKNRKNILKQVNANNETSSETKDSSIRRNSFIQEPLQNNEDSISKNDLPASNDNEENLSITVKSKTFPSLKRKKMNDFTVIYTSNTGDNALNSDTFSQDDLTPNSDEDNSQMDEPKKKICKKLNKLFDETEDWEIDLTNNDLLSSKNDDKICEEIQTNSLLVAQTSPEIEQALKDEKCEDDSKKTDEIEIKKSSVLNRLPIGARPTRAMAMMNSVIGNRAAQILPPVVASPPQRRISLGSTSSSTGSVISPVSRLSRSYALVQATKKKQEDLVKSISDAASCPDLFETVQQTPVNKRSCLKSPFDTEKKKSRRLSFAESIVTDQLFFNKHEPSDQVGRDLSLRKKGATTLLTQGTLDIDDSSQASSSSSSSSNPTSPTKDNSINKHENETFVSPIKRRVLRQTSIISIEDVKITDTPIDDYISETDEEQESMTDKSSNDYVLEKEEETVEIVQQVFSTEGENSFEMDDSQTIHYEMQSVAQDLTGHNVSNIGDSSSYELFNLSAFTDDTTLEDNNADKDEDKENKTNENFLNEAEETPESCSDISDSCYKDACGIFDCDLNEATTKDKKSSKCFESDSLGRNITIINDSSLNKFDKNQLDSEPKVKIELPLSVAKFVFDLLKVSLEPFQT